MKISTSRPFVTLSYAQSLDGCISFAPGKPFQISGPAALAYTHGLRCEHDAILVGIGTVLSDDPCLTVRLVKGKTPQPIVVDTGLKISGTSNLVRNNPLPLWIAAGPDYDPKKAEILMKSNVRILNVPTKKNGWLDLKILLREIKRAGINSLIVEGGAKIISSFINERLVDKIALTISPLFLGGFHAYSKISEKTSSLPYIEVTTYKRAGKDIIIEGYPTWENAPKG